MAFLERRTDDEIDALWEACKAESPSRAMHMYFTGLEFVIPKLGRQELVGDGGEPLTVVIREYKPKQGEEG